MSTKDDIATIFIHGNGNSAQKNTTSLLSPDYINLVQGIRNINKLNVERMSVATENFEELPKTSKFASKQTNSSGTKQLFSENRNEDCRRRSKGNGSAPSAEQAALEHHRQTRKNMNIPNEIISNEINSSLARPPPTSSRRRVSLAEGALQDSWSLPSPHEEPLGAKHFVEELKEAGEQLAQSVKPYVHAYLSLPPGVNPLVPHVSGPSSTPSSIAPSTPRLGAKCVVYGEDLRGWASAWAGPGAGPPVQLLTRL